jgi:hypothetical protein
VHRPATLIAQLHELGHNKYHSSASQLVRFLDGSGVGSNTRENYRMLEADVLVVG